VEGVQDPTSHNLWPFEFIIAVFVGGGAALAGALIGSIVLRIWKRN
jgi:ABC-type branched-subunit amino acid transport system permease subunit